MRVDIINSMSLEYYLLCKKKFDSIIINLTEIIKNYEDIFSNTNNSEILNFIHFLDKYLNVNTITQINSLLTHVKRCKNYCNEKIHKLCIHKFINDTIDITPEKSQNIIYCKICEYTLSNFI